MHSQQNINKFFFVLVFPKLLAYGPNEILNLKTLLKINLHQAVRIQDNNRTADG